MSTSDDTPVTYSQDETRRIHTMLDMPKDPVLCPQCGEPMRIGNPCVTERGRVFQLRCKPCHRTAVIRNDPDA
jgi:ribosomal protein L32